MNDHSLECSEYETLFNISRDMICIASTDGYFKKVNLSFSRVLGYEEKELLEKPFYEFIHPEDIENTLREVEKLKEGNFAVNFENRYRHRDGSYRVLSWSSSPNKEKDFLYAIARDVTEERNTSNKLLQLEKALRSETIVAVTDVDGVIVEANDRFCEISGYAREELIGRTHKVVNSGRHSDEFFSELWRTISSGKVWSGQIINRRKNGEDYIVHTIIIPIIDSQGTMLNYMAVRFDISEHAQIKSELEKTLDILNETSAIAKVGGWELEVATGELTWTDETFNILEVEKRENQKPTLPEGLSLFTPESTPIIDRAVTQAIECGEPYSLELQAKTAKGNVLWVYTNGKANYQDGKVVTLSGTIQDIDAKKIAEKNYELERQKSIQSSKLASLGELSAGVAHEINNPLAIIHGYALLMERNFSESKEMSHFTQEITKSCVRISEIVSSLKKFSRANDKAEFSPCKLVDIAFESIALTSNKSIRELVVVNKDFQSDSYILCNEIEVEQVIVNLINNAIDAVKGLEEKWIKVSILENGEELMLKVEDSGSGIDGDVLDKLFDPFFTTKDTGEGTGLGLSISKGILDEHGASIEVDTASPNTCFVVNFKIHKGL